MKIIAGIFFILHGLVYLFYFAHSLRFFELRADLPWPEGSWAFSKIIGVKSFRKVVSVICIICTVGFVIGGIFLLASVPLWKPVTIGTSVFASLFYILIWDGKIQRLNDKGGYSIIINLIIIACCLANFIRI